MLLNPSHHCNALLVPISAHWGSFWGSSCRGRRTVVWLLHKKRSNMSILLDVVYQKLQLLYMFFIFTKGQLAPPKQINFRKSSKWPLTTPTHHIFLENHIAFVFNFMLTKPHLKIQILKYELLDWKWPPPPFGTVPKIHHYGGATPPKAPSVLRFGKCKYGKHKSWENWASCHIFHIICRIRFFYFRYYLLFW